MSNTEKDYAIQHSEKPLDFSLWMSYGGLKITGLKFMNKVSFSSLTTLFFSHTREILVKFNEMFIVRDKNWLNIRNGRDTEKGREVFTHIHCN